MIRAGVVQKKIDPYLPYDKTDEKSILLHAAKLTGNSLNGLIEFGEHIVGGVNTKGYFGQIVEEGYFFIENNSSPLPDFQDAGIELKVTPMKKTSKGLVSKERLILGIINYDEVPTRHFDIFLDKDSHILIVFYLWEENTDIYDYEFLKVVDWKPTPEELRMIREDWSVIEGYVMRGEAHLLSERHTKYLAACTKGAGHGKDMRSQPFSLEPAKQRALSFKASFMTELYHSHADINETLAAIINDDTTSILHGNWSPEETFEEHVVNYYSRFKGMTCREIESALDISIDDGSKQYYSTLSLAMAGVIGKKHIKEFEEAGILFKTIRTYKNGKPKESMSFPYIRFDGLVEQDWEDSDFFDQLDHEFFSTVFSFTDNPKSQSRKDLVFKGAFFWTIPDEDMPVIESVWSDTKSKVLKNDFDNFIGMSGNPIAHVRPHARDSSDLAMYKGRKVKKLSFWLKDTYIQDTINKHLR